MKSVKHNSLNFIYKLSLRRIFIIAFVFIVVLFNSTKISAQAFQGAVAIGSNLTQVDGDEVFGFKKFGLNASAMAIMPFKDKWSISLEALFSQKGSYQKYPQVYVANQILPYYNLRLNYAEVPIMLHFTDKGFLTFGLGFSYGRLVGVKEIEWGKQTALTLYSNDYLRDDYNIIFNLMAPIYKRLYFDFRYAYSLAKIRTRKFTNPAGDEYNRDQFNNIITVRLIYVFNEVKQRAND